MLISEIFLSGSDKLSIKKNNIRVYRNMVYANYAHTTQHGTKERKYGKT